MRAIAAALLTALLLLSAAGGHVHDRGQPLGAHGSERCAVCVARGADVAHDATPDVAPHAFVVAPVPPEPGAPPVTGAPLGAIPGQSPPSA